MALVRKITITPGIDNAGAVTGHTITANVDVGGEEREFAIDTPDPEVKALVDKLVTNVLKESLQASQAEMQEVVDAEKAFKS